MTDAAAKASISDSDVRPVSTAAKDPMGCLIAVADAEGVKVTRNDGAYDVRVCTAVGGSPCVAAGQGKTVTEAAYAACKDIARKVTDRMSEDATLLKAVS